MLNTVNPPYLWTQTTLCQKYLKKILESFKKQNLNLLCAGNYLYSSYSALCIINNLEMI